MNADSEWLVVRELTQYARLQAARREAVERRGMTCEEGLPVKEHFILHVYETPDGPDGVRWYVECGGLETLGMNNSAAAIKVAKGIVGW